MEEIVLDSVGFIGNIDFAIVLRVFFYIYLFFWLMVVVWVWFDASERSSNLLFKIFGVFVTLFFNIFGLLIYLLVRPTASYEERYLNELEKKYLQLETSGIIKCPSCSFELEPGFVVCPRCGKSVKVKCDNCKEYINNYWEFCAYCGVHREIPENSREKHLQEDRQRDFSVRQDYYLALKRCLYRVGEKQNDCIQKTKEFFESWIVKKEKTNQKVKKIYKSEKKTKGKGRGRKK